MKEVVNPEGFSHAYTGNTIVYYPEGYEESDLDYPVLLFLHGGGEGGSDVSLLRKHGPPREISRGREFPFLVLAPQNPSGFGFWCEKSVLRLLGAVMDKERVDSHRIYLSGMSRGGYASWRLALENPHLFAALAVVCGASAPFAYASRIRHLPIRVYHGSDDPVIPEVVSRQMVEALHEVGASVEYTVISGAGHDVWSEVYASDGLYRWFLDHQRG